LVILERRLIKLALGMDWRLLFGCKQAYLQEPGQNQIQQNMQPAGILTVLPG